MSLHWKTGPEVDTPGPFGLHTFNACVRLTVMRLSKHGFKLKLLLINFWLERLFPGPLPSGPGLGAGGTKPLDLPWVTMADID
ncbi:hypothetical protein EIP86_000204 [Pleurotus ostreatoroseus]|nr:hypothetical protein EIP86_000204 [Pleurotus ostreatoroseus]